MLKDFGKSLIVGLLGWQVRRLRKKANFKVVGVVGSIGKTSTKFAVANVLSEKYKVRFQEGNYNDIVTVPLIFFGQPEPSLFNPFAWIKVLIENEQQISKPYPYEVVVIEIGTDQPGHIAAFKQYLHCDITVVTALTLEHMENFKDLDHVAREELAVADYSDAMIANFDLCSEHHLRYAKKSIIGFGKNEADNKITKISFGKENTTFTLRCEKESIDFVIDAMSMGEIYSAAAAATVAIELDMTATQMRKAVEKLKPVSGRMQRLAGIEDSLILDESYNASPAAVKAALDGLYMLKGQQKIALLGNMNELGEFSEDAHREVGEYCDPKQLDLVLTLGPDANKYLAPAAEKAGCKVVQFKDPYTAGEYIVEHMMPGAIILVKGSQNNVYAEEAIKPLLADKNDQAKLVRQSSSWLAKKRENFNG